MNNIQKIGSIAGVIGTFGVGIIAFNYWNTEEIKKTTTIRDRLTKVGYQILKDEQDEWTKVLNAYKRLPDKGGVFGEVADESALKAKCQAIFDEDKAEKYFLASKWCVKEETIQAMLTRNGYTVIAASTQDGQSQKWQAKIELLKEERNTNEMDLTLGTNRDAQSLEQACKALAITTLQTHASDDYESKFIKAGKWCAEEPVSNV